MKLVLVDGNAILHRAFHALPPLTTTKGELVNAVYGFISMLLKIQEEFHPEYLVVCFDRPKPTFRQAIFIGYQAKRPKMDEGLAGQIEKVHEAVRVFKIPIYEMDGYEADDLLGTLSLQAVEGIKNSVKAKNFAGGKKPKVKDLGKKTKIKNDLEVVIVTGDRDILQLVDARTSVYMPIKGLSEAKLFGEKEVKEKLGVKPKQIIDYKGMMGDSSDNYGGIPGIGPKTASGLLNKYQSLEEVFSHLNELPLKIKEKFVLGKDSGLLAQKLATIVRNAPVKLDLEKARVVDFNNEEVLSFLKKMEFHSLIKRLPGYEQKTKVNTDKNQLELF